MENSPQKVFFEVLDNWSIMHNSRKTPGAAYNRLSEETKNILKSLRAEDIEDPRIENIIPGDYLKPSRRTVYKMS